MSVLLGNIVLDNGLTYLQSKANRIALCSAQPTSFANVAVVQLGSATFGAGGVFTGPTTGVPNGRQVTSVAVTNGSISQGGTATYIAVVDDINAGLLVTAPVNTPLAVAISNAWQLAPFTVTIGSGATLMLSALSLTAGAPVLGKPVLTALLAPIVNAGTFSATEPLTNGFVIGTMTASGGVPTSWSINTGNSLGYFTINNSGVITVTAAGAAGLTTAQNFTLGVQASNTAGSSSGTASLTINAAVTGNPFASIDGSAGAPGDTGDVRYTFFRNPASIATPMANPLAKYHAAGFSDARVFGTNINNFSPGNANYRQPPWYAAGFDYPVGIRPQFLPLKDVRTNVPSGCSLSGNQLNVNSNNVTIQGLDFSTGGGVNLWVPGGGSTTGTLVSDCYFKMTASNTTDCIDGNNSQITVQYCAVDGNNISTSTASTTNRLWKVNYLFIQNTAQDTFNYGANQTNDATTQGFFVQFSVILNGGVGDGHGDWLQVGGPPSAGFPWNLHGTFCTWIAEGAAAPFGGNAGTQGWIWTGQSNPPMCGVWSWNTAITAKDGNGGTPISEIVQMTGNNNDGVAVAPGIQIQWNYMDPTGASPVMSIQQTNLVTANGNMNIVTGLVDGAAGFPHVP